MAGGSTLLNVLLLVNMFILGVAVALAYMHWHRHIRAGELSHAGESLPEQIRHKVYEQAQDDYEKVLRRSAVRFGKDLDTTTEHLSKQLDALTGDLVEKEVARYKSTMTELQDDATKRFGEAGEEIDSHRAELETRLQERLKTMDDVLTEHQKALEKSLAERTSELERDFKEIQADYAKKQAALESSLATQEAELASGLKQREAQLASHQAQLEDDLVARQQAFVTKQNELEQKLDAEMAKRREQYTAAVAWCASQRGNYGAARDYRCRPQHLSP